jgi:hypothetical protein
VKWRSVTLSSSTSTTSGASASSGGKRADDATTRAAEEAARRRWRARRERMRIMVVLRIIITSELGGVEGLLLLPAFSISYGSLLIMTSEHITCQSPKDSKIQSREILIR